MARRVRDPRLVAFYAHLESHECGQGIDEAESLMVCDRARTLWHAAVETRPAVTAGLETR